MEENQQEQQKPKLKSSINNDRRAKFQNKPRLSSVSVNEIKTLNQEEEIFSDHDEDEKEEEEEQQFNQLFKSDTDYDRLSIVWSNVLMLAIVYNTVTCFYFLGVPGFPTAIWLYLEFLFEVMFLIDLLMRFIFLNFFKKQWDALILLHETQDKLWQKIFVGLTSVPSSIIMYVAVPRFLHNTLWVAFIRAFKLLRVRQLNHYFDVRDLRTRRNSFLRTLQSILYILLITHLLGCFWLFVGRIDPDQDNNWMRLVLYDKYEVPEIQKYVDSIFFVVSSMTGLGFAYIYPRTTLEYAMQSLIMIVGVSIYANFFAFFAVSIYNRNRKRIENMKRLEESKKLAVLRNFPTDVRTKIRNFYNNLRLRYDSLCDKFDILQELPNSLKSELSLFINSEVIQKVNFFQFADPAFILIISKFLKPKLCLDGNYIIYLGEVATKMYFIKSGIVQVLSTDNKTVIAYMSEGTYFGEIGVLITQKRTCFVKAKTSCVFFTLRGSDLIEVLEKFPIQDKFLRAVAKQRLQTTEPEDLIEKDQEFENAAKDQVESKSIESKRELGSMFNLVTKQQQHQLNLIKLKTQDFELRKKKKPRFYLTEEFKLVQYFAIIPFSWLFNIWSVVFCLGFTYQLLYIPFSLGSGFEITNVYYLIDVVAMIIMIADSVLRPFLAINEFGEIVVNRQTNMKFYLTNCFLYDILSSIPFDYFLLIIDETETARQCVRLLRLLKLYRVNELIKIVRNNSSIDEQLFRICQLFFIFLMVIHWFTCILMFITIREYRSNSRFDGKNLLQFMTSLPYSKVPPPDKMTKWELYFNLIILCTCYMGSIMYGDIIPFTLSEELLGILQMIIGRIFISFLFAEISSYVSSQYSAYNSHIEQKNKITKWMQLNNIEPSLRRRVNKFFDFKWENQKGIDEYKILKDLPRSLRVNVKNYIFHNLIMHSDVFPKENEGAISTITAKLQRRLVPKSEFVIKQGELATEMFFIMKGEVIVVSEDGITVAHLKKYMHFGEMALIEKKASVRSISVRAATDVVLAVLTSKDFDLICHHYPEFYTRMKESQEQRQKDSLSKGVRISNARRQTIHNLNIAKFLQSKRTFRVSSNPQLSMIEEESKRESEKNDQGNQIIEEEEEGDNRDKNRNFTKTDQVQTDQELENSDIVRPLNINDLENGTLTQGLQTKRNSTYRKSMTQKDPSTPAPLNIMTENDLMSDRNVLSEESQSPIAKAFQRQGTIEVEQKGIIRIWEAPKLLSSVSDLNQYFKNVKGGSKKVYRKIIAIFLAQTFKQAILFIIVLYNIVFIPLQMGFMIQFKGIYLFMEIMTLLVYSLDILLIVRTYRKLKRSMEYVRIAPIESQQKTISDFDELQRRLTYAKLNLISSVIGVLPFSWILQSYKDPLFVLNALRVLRLVKIWPFYRIIQLFKRINVNVVRWFEMLITYYIVAHIVAGVMLSVGLTASDIRMTWLNRVPSPLPEGVRQENNLDGVTNQSLYIHALYFATNTISHVAIGDLTTISTSERALNAFIIWNLCFFYAFCFANIASIVGDFLGNNFLLFHEKYTNVRSMITDDKMPKEIRENVDKYYDYIWSHSQGFNEQVEVFGELPHQIKYDIMMCRYQEAIQNSLIYKNEQGKIDIPMVNSIFELIQIRIYMRNDFIVKCGSYGQNLYLFLDGEALLVGINGELVHIMTSGTHFNNELDPDFNEHFNGKRICHIIAKTLTVVAVIDKDNLKTLFEVYPYWQKIITRLNRSLYNKCRVAVKKYIAELGYDDTYRNEFQAVENHLTFSDDNYYKRLVKKFQEPQYRFIYNPQALEYQRFDFLQHQLKAFQNETGIVQQKKNQEASTEGSVITRSTGYLGSSQYNLTLEQYQSQQGSKLKRCWRNLYFPQNSTRRKFVDFLHLINMIYISISLPLLIAFIDTMRVTLVLEIISILIQLVVIVTNIRTPIIVRGGYTLQFYPVIRNYFNNGLIIDLFGLLPFNLILGYINVTYPNITIISILRLIRIVSIKKLLQTFEKFEVYLKRLSILMYIMKAILILFLLWHWTSCFWMFINRKIEPDLYENSWYKVFKMQEKSIAEQYLLSYYYVMKIVTGVGQSDMITYNDLERVCFMLIINVGDSLFAFAFGLIASIQLHIFRNSEFQQFMEKMKQIDEFLVSINAEQSQRDRVEQYFSYNYYTKSKIRLIETMDLNGLLPYYLQKEVIYYSLKDILNPMFKTFKSDNLVKEVSAVLTNVIFMPGDYIIYKDQIGEEMYFIVEGSVQIIAADKETVLKTLTKGNYFGEIAIFMHTKRISYVQSKTFCVVSMLRKIFLDDIILNFPEVAKQFSIEAQKRINETLQLEQKKQEQEGESYGDDFDYSFIQAINQKLENSYFEMQSDRSNNSLLKTVKRKSLNIAEDHLTFSKSKTKFNTHSPNQKSSSNFMIKVENLNKHPSQLKEISQSEDEEYFKSSQRGGTKQQKKISMESKDEELKLEHRGCDSSDYDDEEEAKDQIAELDSHKKESIIKNEVKKKASQNEYEESSSDSGRSHSLSSNENKKSPAPQFNHHNTETLVPRFKEGTKQSPLPPIKRASNMASCSPQPYMKKSTEIWMDKMIHSDTKGQLELDSQSKSSSLFSPSSIMKSTISKRRNTVMINKQNSPFNLASIKSNKPKKEPLPKELMKVQIKKQMAEEGSNKQEMSSIRRQGKKKVQRRLSKISMGKNLMLSQTAGLKLQWTVGK